jgi:osmotically-inducible protein OsmY
MKNMKKYLIIFIIGVVVGSGGYWTLRDGPLATKVRESSVVQKIGEQLDERAAAKMKEEMDKQGKIVLNKPPGSTIPILADGLLRDLVKAKIAADPELSGTDIKTEVKSGDVTLSGTATSYDQVATATRLALACDATRSVISSIAVKPK